MQLRHEAVNKYGHRRPPHTPGITYDRYARLYYIRHTETHSNQQTSYPCPFDFSSRIIAHPGIIFSPYVIIDNLDFIYRSVIRLEIMYGSHLQLCFQTAQTRRFYFPARYKLTKANLEYFFGK